MIKAKASFSRDFSSDQSDRRQGDFHPQHLFRVIARCSTLLAFCIQSPASVNAAATGGCERLLSPVSSGKIPQVYSQADFGASKVRPKGGADSQALYQKWASEWSNWSADAFSRGTSSEDVFESVAFARARLARQLGNTPAREFGSARIKRKGEKTYSPIGLLSKKEPNALKRKLVVLANDTYHLTWNTWEALTTPGILTDDKKIRLIRGAAEGGRIGFDGNYLFVEHPSVRSMQRVFSDVHRRIERLLSPQGQPWTEDEKRTEFLTIMYEYYNALPYFRGSAAIGNVVFSGLYYKVFEEKMPAMEDGIDMIAMILQDDEQFVMRVQEHWGTRGP